MVKPQDKRLYIGVDLGTCGLKAGAFDAAGNLLAEGQTVLTMQSPMSEWVEQNPQDWWAGLCHVLNQMAASVDLSQVASVSVVGQGPTLVALDEQDQPVRPAITWADRRAAGEAQQLQEILSDPNVNMEFDILPRILWVQAHEPESFARVRWLLQAYDYLAYRLTRVPVTVHALPGMPPWTDDRIREAGLPAHLFPPLGLDPGSVIGGITPQAAAETGLPPSTQVVAGMVDAFAHWIGVGLSRPGQLCSVAGTSQGVALVSATPLSDAAGRVFALPNPLSDTWVVGGAMSNSGGVLDWVMDTFYPPGTARDRVLADIEAIPAGAEGVLALPYFLGERTPVYDPAARACLVGMGPQHQTAHMGRALLEGVGYGLLQVTTILEEIGGHVDEVVLTGGTARARVWNQIKAEILGRPVRVAEVVDSGVLGAAILARSGVEGRPIAQVAASMVTYGETIHPDPANVERYAAQYPFFTELYVALQRFYPRWQGVQGPSARRGTLKG